MLGVKFRKRGLGRVHNGRGAMVEGGVGGGDLRRAAERSAVAAFWCQAAWKEGVAASRAVAGRVRWGWRHGPLALLCFRGNIMLK